MAQISKKVLDCIERLDSWVGRACLTNEFSESRLDATPASDQGFMGQAQHLLDNSYNNLVQDIVRWAAWSPSLTLKQAGRF